MSGEAVNLMAQCIYKHASTKRRTESVSYTLAPQLLAEDVT